MKIPRQLRRMMMCGFISFNSYDVSSGSKSRLVSPSINISELTNPVLGFWMFNYIDPWSEEPANDRLQVQISVDDATFVNIGDELVMSASNNGWTYYELSLFDYRNSSKVNIGFTGISGYGFNVLVDNITIVNSVSNDLAVVSFTGPKRIGIAEEVTYAVSVQNKGAETTSSYSVELYNGSNLIKSSQGQVIEPNQKLDFSFSAKATLDDITTGDTYYPYYAKVVFTADEVTKNNVFRYHSCYRSYPGISGS